MADGDAVQFQSPTTGAVQPVPPEHWDEALKQGYKPTTHKVMYSPDGQRGMVRNEELRDYMQQGYQTTPKTQFEKDRPGKGITAEGMGGEAFETLKGIPGGFLRNQLGADILHPSKWPIGQAMREGAAGWQREGAPGTRFDTVSRLGGAVTSGLGSLLGMSGERAAEAGERGEGGKILGQAAVPTALALAGPVVEKAASAARPALRNWAYKELPTTGRPTLTPSARGVGSLGGAGLGAITGGMTGVPGGAYIGGHTGLLAGPSLLERMIGAPELGDIRNPGPFGKIPMRAPRPTMQNPPSPPNPFQGMTPSRGPLGNAELPALPQGEPTPFPTVKSKSVLSRTSGSADKPFEPLVWGSPEEAAAHDVRMENLQRQARSAGTYHAAQGASGKRLNLQQRIGKKALPFFPEDE